MEQTTLDQTTRDFRAASHLPPLSVCLLLAVAAFGLLLTRTESSGEPADGDSTVPGAAAELETAREPAEIKALRQDLARAERMATESPERAVELLRRTARRIDEVRPRGELAVEVYGALGRALDAAGDHEAAVEIWWRMLSMAPRHEVPARKLAVSLHASGRPDEARRVAREMLHEDLDLATEPEPADDLGGS